MMHTFILILALALISGQDVDDSTVQLVNQVFPNRSDPFRDLEEVTKAPSGSIGALQKCGEEADQGVHLCVSYHLCDGKTKTIVQTGVTNGFGIIDIRFGENSCGHPLEVCCKIPEGGLDPNLPLPGDPTPAPTSSTRPPVGPVITVTPIPTPSPSFCGIRNDNGIDFKITGNGDHEAEYGEFPWMVAIINKQYNPADVNQRPLICGGSLITPTVVLTGAHCVGKFSPSDIKVRAGEWDTQTDRERLPYQERDVVNIVSHNQFDTKSLYNDFALLVLNRAVDKAENVGTICLPTQGQQINSKNCFVSGWGKDFFGKEGKFQAILKKIELPVVGRTKCQNALRNTRLGANFQLHRSFMCAGGEQGKDACTGDGGSPLVCPDPLNPHRYVQAGIVAWGIGCGEFGVPGVYADVTKFRTWIDQQMERLNLDTASYNQ